MLLSCQIVSKGIKLIFKLVRDLFTDKLRSTVVNPSHRLFILHRFQDGLLGPWSMTLLNINRLGHFLQLKCSIYLVRFCLVWQIIFMWSVDNKDLFNNLLYRAACIKNIMLRHDVIVSRASKEHYTSTWHDGWVVTNLSN
jgi:hypothetical protein